MAQPLFDPTSLNFGVVPPGVSKSLTITFTNLTTPKGTDVEVTISGPGAPFSVSDSNFILTDYGESKVVTITYAPTSTGNDDSSLTITHDSGTQSPASGYTFDLTATCDSNRTEYELADIANNPAGTMSVSLFLETDFTAPTVPTANTIVSMGPLTERVDFTPGVVDIESMEIEIVDDYSTYTTEGFWYHVLQSEPEREVSLRFILNENGTDTFYFWGKVYRQETEWSEKYVANDDSRRIRTVKLTLVSMIHVLTELPVSSAISVIEANESAIADSWTIESILTSILAAGLYQAYDTADIVIRNSDIRFLKTDGSTEVAPEDCYVSFPVSTPDEANRGYFSIPEGETNPYHWNTRYESTLDLLKAICLNFGWVCRYYFGQVDGSYAGDATDKHHLEFVTRGNSYAGDITPDSGVIESTLTSGNSNQTANVKVSDLIMEGQVLAQVDVLTDTYILIDASTGLAWYANGKEYTIRYNFADIWSKYNKPYSYFVEPPDQAKFDLEFTLEFVTENFEDHTETVLGNDIFYLFSHWRTLHYNNSGTLVRVAYVKYYDYEAGAWVDSETHLQNALVKYYRRRFSSGKKQVRRKYNSLKFDDGTTVSHLNMKPMVRISINDGENDIYYYASEVIKDFQNYTTEVLWVQE